MQLSRSEQLFAEAQQYIPGGVNSPVRSFRAVGGIPPFIARGQGSRVWDVDGNEYIDYLGSWGPLALGHAHPAVVEALRRAAEGGSSFGAPVENEVELARLVCNAFPSVDMVRLVNSGTEACMSAIRLARAFTGRDKIIKFAGCYHGHADGLLVRAGSGAMTHGIPTSAGVPESYATETLVADFNDLASVEAYFESFPSAIAGIIVEPVAGNMGVVLPAEGFLEGLRDIASRDGALLIFDEVITGFRVGPQGAQGLFGITPDITAMGKIIGGGLPVGAYGGRREIMERVAPLGDMYQAGTLSGNPLAVSAGVATLTELQAPGVYEQDRRPGPAAHRRTGPGLPAGRGSRHNQPGRVDVHRVYEPRPGGEAGAGGGVGRRALRTLLPRDAGAGRIHRAVPVRGRVRVHGPHRGGHRRDHCQGGRCAAGTGVT